MINIYMNYNSGIKKYNLENNENILSGINDVKNIDLGLKEFDEKYKSYYNIINKKNKSKEEILETKKIKKNLIHTANIMLDNIDKLSLISNRENEHYHILLNKLNYISNLDLNQENNRTLTLEAEIKNTERNYKSKSIHYLLYFILLLTIIIFILYFFYSKNDNAFANVVIILLSLFLLFIICKYIYDQLT